MNLKDIHLFLIRIYIGIDCSHHFAEKFGPLGPQPVRRNSGLPRFSSNQGDSR